MMETTMDEKRKLKATLIARIILMAFFLIAFFYATSGSWLFWQAWIYSGVFFVSGAIGIAYLYRKEPDLLLRRMRVKEKRSRQRFIIYTSYPIFLAVMVLPGLDFRFGWSQVPVWWVIFGDFLYLLGYSLFLWVVITNRYAGRTVEVESEQQVIQTGPYAQVRHPMYVASVLVLFCSPLALGSIPAVISASLILPIIILRILDEEKTLREELPGYEAYCQRVRYRLIPGIW